MQSSTQIKKRKGYKRAIISLILLNQTIYPYSSNSTYIAQYQNE